MKMSNNAFTLAEVLITLAIIGVVSAMTIPSLIQNIQNADLQVQWKKAFSELASSTKMIQTNGDDIDFTSDTSFRSSYESVMKFTKQDMWDNLGSTKYTYYKNTSGVGAHYNLPSAILPNGVYIGFHTYGSNCTTQRGIVTEICGYIFVDLNGKRSPNMWGRDYLPSFVVKKNGGYVLYPVGSNGDGYTCEANSTSDNTSDGCAAIALYSDKMP